MILEKDIQPVRNTEGQLTVRLESLLAMAGHLPPDNLSHQFTIYNKGWDEADGLIFRHSYLNYDDNYPDRGPFEAHEVHKEANAIIEKANRWVHDNLRAFKRHARLSPFEAMIVWKFSQQPGFVIVRHQLGSTVEVRRLVCIGERPNFWSVWEKFGSFTGEVVKSEGYRRDLGYPYVNLETAAITFNRHHALLYTAAGSVKGDELLFRELHVAS